MSPGSDDTVIDLGDRTVLPGLIEVHVHLTGQYSASSNLDRFVLHEADYAFDATMYAKRTLEAGKQADIIAVPGNPLDDITALRRVSFVMKGGKVYKQ